MSYIETILPFKLGNESIVYFTILFSFIVTFVICPLIIKVLYKFNFIMKTKLIPGVNDEYIKIHGGKVGTPTMGGVIIGVGFFVSAFILSLLIKINNYNLGLYLLPAGLFFFFGLIDDITSYGRKLSTKAALMLDSLAFKIVKLFLLFFITYFSIWYSSSFMSINQIALSPLPFVIPINLISIGIITILSLYLIYGLEITDGADGLFTGNVLITLFGVLALLPVSTLLTETVIIALLIGALFAYLYYNIKPARIFMGASGTYPVAISLILITILHNLFVPFLIMGLFYWAVVSSSALQIFWIRVYKKRLFQIAPLHHWLEAKFKWEETKVVERSWWFTAIITILALLIYRL